jgi:hypothetical protein
MVLIQLQSFMDAQAGVEKPWFKSLRDGLRLKGKPWATGVWSWMSQFGDGMK